jgi:hypothetical protein
MKSLQMILKEEQEVYRFCYPYHHVTNIHSLKYKNAPMLQN